MEHVNFYIFNTLVNPPQNWEEMTLEINYDKDKTTNKANISITDWDFVRENSILINKHISDGLTTGTGVFEGIPFRIEIERAGALEVPFNGYIDLVQSTSISKNIKSHVKAVEIYSVDWLNDVADSFTYDYLFNQVGSITQSDFIKVPYIISSIPNYTNAVVAIIGVYVMVKEVKDAIHKIAEFVAELPVYYVFSTYIRLILYIIYLILVIIALVKLIKDVIQMIIQPVKYHSGMKVSTLLKKGCEQLGLTLKSEEFDTGGVYENVVIIPSKYYAPENSKDSRILGLTDPKIDQLGFYKGTFGQLLRDVKQLINGKIIMNGSELIIVRNDFADTGNNYTLPPLYNPYFSLNASEFHSNTYITYETDLSDKNTIHYYLGTAFQVQAQPTRINYSNMVLMKGLNEVRLPFALAKRKVTLTGPEKVLSTFLKVTGKILGAMVKAVNAVIKVLNKIIDVVNKILKKLATIGIKLPFKLPDIPLIKFPDFGNLIADRINMMLIENDLFNTAKIVDLKISNDPRKTKISDNNATILSARYAYEHYYYVDSFVPTSDRPNANQYYLKEEKNIKFSFQDYLKVKNNNFIFTSEGEQGQIDSLKWNPRRQTADVKVRISKLYTNNLTNIEYEPDGQ